MPTVTVFLPRGCVHVLVIGDVHIVQPDETCASFTRDVEAVRAMMVPDRLPELVRQPLRAERPAWQTPYGPQPRGRARR